MALGGSQTTVGVTLAANMDPSGVLNAVKQMQGAFSGLKLPGDIGADLEKSFNKATDLLKKYQTQLSKGINTKTDAKNITKTGSQINEVLDEIVTHINSINGQQIFLKADVSGLNTLKTNIEDARTAWKNAIQEFRKGSDIEKVLNEIAEKTTRSNLTQGSINSAKTLFDKGDLEGYRNALDDIYNRLKNLKDTTIKNVVENLGLQDAGSKVANLEQIKKRLEDISKIDFSGDSNVDTKFKAITTAVTEYETEVKRASQAGQNAFNDINVDKAVKDTRNLVDATDQYKNSVMSAKDQVQQLQQSTQYFFSLRNMINLLKRGISDAVQTVKELDAAMTETAVVTDFSVGDMWAKLPEYTANANKLGATIQDMYESTTLYYQQGLNTEQSMAIAAETMKMARIAGLEAKDATDMMTAALRGFNMELNETSATRINDVYSNLAAKTASDTEEIGKAMQRTASIAHSAGMSFEGTAAFLAQAVETTREPAENIGTAMKTIVARFQEMKKNPLEITEVDGEEVSYNKVDAALQSIGVSLKDANGQFRELDKVFLDISKKWNSLSQTQQRYIATIAAGSRQQSRFIAMMGDYDRTVELMSYANDSAGASQEQFNKTLDSLEAKLNKFQNAWDQFLMGIMNDSWVKGIVDVGTTILKTVNSIIDALSFGGKAKGLKSLLSIGTAGVALKAGGNLINKLIGGVGGFIDPASSFGKGFWGAGKTTQEGTPATGVAGKITTPIVAKLNELIAVTRKANNLKDTNTQITSTLGQYKNVSAMLRNPNSLNMGDIRSLFGGLSDEHAYMAYRNTPGTVDAMKQAALGWLGSTKMPVDANKTGQQLMDSIFKGMSKKEISIKDGMKLMGKPALWGEYFGTDVAKGFSQRYIEQFKSQVPEMRQKTQQAIEQTWQQLLGDNASNKAMQQGFLASQVGKDKFNAAYKNNRLFLGLDKDLKDIPIAQTNLQKFANTVGGFGSRMSAAGISIQQFGIQLGQISPALEGVGTLLVRVGGALSTFGMGFSSIGSVATKAIGRISAAGVAAKGAWSAGLTAKTTANVFLGTLTEGLSAGAIGGIIGTAIIGGILIAKGIADKKAREAGEEVRENFEQGFIETNKKIDSITEYKDRFNELSQGVDQFGHNINLTDEEFDEYLTISRELQELSPSLISGYNAEGQAVLRKGAALDEVIDKLKEERDLSLQDYITDDSIDKLIGEYNTSDAYKNHNTIKMGDSGMGDAFSSEKSGISKALKEAEVEWSDFSQILDELGIGSAESISDLSNRQLSMISAHYTDILNKIKEFNPQIEEEAEDGLKEAFAETNNALEDVLTEGAPVVDALRQWMGQEKLDAVGLGLSEEFVSGFNSGLDGLMVEGLTNNWKPEEYKAQLRDYASEWEHLAGPTSAYANILSEADKIQQDYLDHVGEDGAIENYENDVEGLATQLESLAEQYKGTGAAGEVFAEQCQQQANNLRNYATEGVISLSEALNTLSDEFASARGAQERFQKATEGGDYYTAAEGYKSIIDTMLDEKNVAGDGSLAFWAGADELLGQQFVDSHTSDEIIKQVEKIQSCFEDGLPGIQAFGDLLVENADKLKGLGEINKDTGQFEFNFKNLDDLEQYAELLGMSEDALAALIDKSRQYVPWNLSDPGEIRKAIESSEYSMAGTSTKGENLVYTSESQFRAEARQQGIRGDDYTSTKTDAEERGVRFLNVENLTAKKGDGLYADQVLENIGLKGQDKTVENAVAAFTKMGLDLEDTKQVLMSDGIKLANGEEATAENIEQAYNEQAYAMENPTVAGIATDASTLVSNTSAMLAAMGILTDEAKKEIDQSTSDETTQGYIDNLNNASNVDERNQARTTMEDKVSEYNALANKLIESGRTETDPYVQKLRSAAETLQTELDAEAINWNDKAVAANQYLKDNNIIPQGATQEEQTAIQTHAVDIQSAIESGDAQVVLETLKQIETEGNLSIETMIGLGKSISDLGAVDSSTILHFISEYYEKLKLARQESSQPFEIETKFTGEKLEDHISKVKEFTAQEYAFLVRADITGEEKVSTLINSINQEFGKGDEETKTILIDAVAKTASGDKEGAHDILAEAFGEDKAETIEKKIDVLCDGSVANKDEVTSALKRELESTIVEPKIKAKAQVSIDNISANKKLKHQSGTVDYKTGKVAPVEDQQATLNYKTGKIPPVPAQRTDLNFNVGNIPSIPDQEVNIYPKLKGSGTYKVTAYAKGRGYSIPAHSSLSFGSAAQGMNIPKKKQSGGSSVTALVGEEGFEVGYIPSEGRSVIFGTNGPEMTSFPSDTVIYPHKQSKEILRRGKGGHQSLGSFRNGSNTGKSGGIPTSTSGSSGSSGSDSKKRNNNKDKSSTHKQQKKNVDNAAKVIKKAGKINAWWWNMGKKVESLQRKIDKTLKEIQKTTKEVGKTLADVALEGNKYIKNLNRQITLNQQMQTKAQSKLNMLDSGPKKGSKTQKSISKAQQKVDKAETKLKKAQKSHDTKRIKKAKAELKTAKKNLKKKQNTANYSTVSYDVTTKKGKKKTKKTKKQKINLAPFVVFDEETGAYVVDYNKINSKNWDKSKKKAVMEAAEKKVENYQQKRDTAEDNIQKAQEALDDLSNQLYEEFYGWELQLTKIWNITQKIEETTGHIGRLSSYLDLLDAKVASGTIKEINTEFITEYLKVFQDKMQAGVRKMQQQIESIELRKFELQDKLNINANDQAIANIGSRVGATETLQNEINDAQILADKRNDTYAAKKSAKNAAKTTMATAKKKYGKKSKQYKKAQQKYNKALKAFNTAKANKQEANSSLKNLQTAYTNGVSNGTYYSETDQLANKGYVKELENDKLIRELARKFTQFKTNADGTVSVDFDTERFIEAKNAGEINSTTAERLQNYVQSIVDATSELNSMFEDTTQSLIEQEQTLEQLKDDWAGYGEQLLSYVEEEQSKELDKIKKLSEAIDNSLKDLLDRVKQDLDRRRQQEDNTKTEKNINKKQQRLAVLQADTSGGNQVEIAKLQQEIAQEQQDYQRTLEDQLLDRLNRQADEASKQREKQISLQENILQATNNAALVNKWMDNPEKYKAEIQKAFYDQAEYDSLTKAQQEQVDRKFNELYTGLLTNPDKRVATEQSILDTQYILNEIRTSLANMNKTSDNDNDNIDNNENDDNNENNNNAEHPLTPEEAEKLAQDAAAQARLKQQIADYKANYERAKDKKNPMWASDGSVADKYYSFLLKRGNKYNTGDKNWGKIGAEGLDAQIKRGAKLGFSEKQVLNDLAYTEGLNWTEVIQALVNLRGKKSAAETLKTYFGNNPSDSRKAGWKNVFKKAYPKYAAGGLASYTGPAWLDGTPSKPELVLNSTDTKNLIALKDVLGKVMKGSLTTTTENQGDILYEININVDRIEKDYDVDKVVDKVKREITRSAGYRNVTQVRNIR